MLHCRLMTDRLCYIVSNVASMTTKIFKKYFKPSYIIWLIQIYIYYIELFESTIIGK